MNRAAAKSLAILELCQGYGALVYGDGTIVAANARLRTFLGAPPDAAKPSLLDSLASSPEEFADIVRRCLGSSQATMGALALRSASGRVEHLRVQAVSVERARRRENALIAVNMTQRSTAGSKFRELNTLVEQLREEVLRRRTAEERLRTAFAELKRQDRAKSDFLAHVSHEFRTPLNAINGMAEIMESEMLGGLPTRYREYASDIRMSGRHLLGIVNRVIDLTKVEAGAMELKLEMINLGEILRECERMIRPIARDRRIELLIPQELQLPALEGDARMLREIALNLITNAVAYSPDGEAVRVEIRSYPKRRPDHLLLAVADRGAGIKREDMPSLFQPFHRLGNAYTRSTEGMGLGLWLVQTFVAAHGGSVRLISRVGHGTTAVVRLPSRRAA